MSSSEIVPNRPLWAQTDPLLQNYYDQEWGQPVVDEQGLFERISLEAFQSGLSWRTILVKRPAFREHFADFDPDTVAKFDANTIAALLDTKEIVRNRLKILATINNAQATVALRKVEPLSKLIWRHQPTIPLHIGPDFHIPTETEESRQLAKSLKSAGFKFVGPVTAFALMCAVGVVNPHPAGSDAYTRVERAKTEHMLT